MSFIEYVTTCPECDKSYRTSDETEVHDPDRLCPDCFEVWGGMTLEQILGSVPTRSPANKGE